MAITVYSLPSCSQCTATTRMLDRIGAEYEVIDMGEDAAALDWVREQGYKQAPVVVTPEQSWAGFRPDLIRSVKQSAAA